MAKIPNVRKDSQISSSTHEVQKNLASEYPSLKWF